MKSFNKSVFLFRSESYINSSVNEEQPIDAKNYVEEHETSEVEEDAPQEPMNIVHAEMESSRVENRISNDDRVKQNDIIKQAGSVILSTCYETAIPGDTVVEAYEETVNCVSSPSYANVSDNEENQLDSEHDETVATNEQVTVVDDDVDHQPPIKKTKLWDERDSVWYAKC